VAAGAASDAFKPLGNETRVAVLRAMFEREDGSLRPTSRTFSELYEATDESTTAGFAYHLRQLVGPYLRKHEDEESYELTYAGPQVGRGLAAGTYTESVDREPVALAEDCPICAEPDLALRPTDNVATVGCDACDRGLLALPFPPGGFRSRGADSLPGAFDRHHRHRIALMADGNCPECGGQVEGRIDLVEDDPTVEADGSDEADGLGASEGSGSSDGSEDPREFGHALASLDCGARGYALGCPVTLTTLAHPAVVSFFHDHDVDLRDRPIWNVGPEWGERVVSTEPLAVRVSATLDGETLVLYLGRDLIVVLAERAGGDDDRTRATGSLEPVAPYSSSRTPPAPSSWNSRGLTASTSSEPARWAEAPGTSTPPRSGETGSPRSAFPAAVASASVPIGSPRRVS